MKKLAILLALLLFPLIALGQTGAYSGHTFVGGVPATTSGMKSSNYLDGIIPGASITVYLTGTSTLATIYADGSNTPLSNPFFSNLAAGTNPGGFIFWSLQNQGLDIQAQGGMGNASCTTSPLCYPTATTLQKDVYPNNSISPFPLPISISIGGTGATTAAGANLNITGVTQTGTLGTSSQVSTFPGTVVAGAAVANFVQSVSCTNGNNSVDYTAVQNAINYIQANAPNGQGTLRVPENTTCNILPPSSTATEALLVTGAVSLENHGRLNFQMPAPSTASVTACSTANVGLVTTATITAANSFVAGWTGTFPVTGTTGSFSGACAPLNGRRFTVLSTGLSSSQFEYVVPLYIATPISASDTATASATMSAIHFKATATLSNMKWQNGTFNMVSAPSTKAVTGGDMFNFDCSVGGNYDFFRMDNLWINGSSLGFNSLFMDNDQRAGHGSTNGCVYESHFKDMVALSGAYYQNVGDDNTWSGKGQYTNGGGDGFNAYSMISLGNSLVGPIFEGTGSAIHLRGGPSWLIEDVETANDQAGANATANIWLDSTGYVGLGELTGTIIENSRIGIDSPAVANGAPLIQIDNRVYNTTIRSNYYNPQILAGVPQCAVLNNGGLTSIEGLNTFSSFNSYPKYCGSGAWGANSPVTEAGGGKTLENDVIWSEDATRWNVYAHGAGSSATVSTTPTAVTMPNGTPGFANAITLTLGSQIDSTYYAQITVPSAVTLPNPHGVVYKLMVMPTACPTATQYTVIFNGSLLTFNCNGIYNGWTQFKWGEGSSAPSIPLIVHVLGGSVYSSSVSFYATWAQISMNDSDYVKTTSQAVPLSYGINPQGFAGPYPVAGLNGWQDISTALRGPCTVLNYGLLYTEKGTGPNGSDLVLECTATSAGGASYGWQTLYQIPAPSENYLLQSNTWNVSPWVLGNGGVGSIPVVTAAPGVVNPFGNTGSVQEVVFNLNGGTTAIDASRMTQTLSNSKPNPHAATVSAWLRTATGTGTVYFGNVFGSNYTFENLTTTWQLYTVPASAVPNANDDWYLGITGTAPTGANVDLYVFGAGLTYNGGSPVTGSTPAITTTAPIDQTSNAPVLAAPGTSAQLLIAQGGGAYAPETMSGSCTITSAGVITCPTPPAITTVPGWLQYLGTGTEGSNLTASGTMSGSHYYVNFTVPFGNTVTVNSNTGLVIHATGTCTIAGTINANGTVSAQNAFNAASGGGGGGGAAAGTAGTAGFVFYASVGGVTGGGTAGTLTGGTGGNGTAAIAAYQQMILNGGTTGGIGLGGSNGGAGGSSGPAGGFGGQGVVFMCASVTGTDGSHTGTINANGANGGASTGNGVGSSGGGAGGVVILSSQAAIATPPTITTAGGTGGTCGAFSTCGVGGNGGAGWSAVFQGW